MHCIKVVPFLEYTEKKSGGQIITERRLVRRLRLVRYRLVDHFSPNAAPPVAKIMDYGKFQYAENKKQKAAKAKAHNTEVKSIQIKIGTSEHDLGLKAKRVGEWLAGGNLVKIDLFLIGRSKYMEFKFLQERLARILKLIPVAYKIADPVRKGMKGLTVVIEKQ